MFCHSHFKVTSIPHACTDDSSNSYFEELHSLSISRMVLDASFSPSCSISSTFPLPSSSNHPTRIFRTSAFPPSRWRSVPSLHPRPSPANAVLSFVHTITSFLVIPSIHPIQSKRPRAQPLPRRRWLAKDPSTSFEPVRRDICSVSVSCRSHLSLFSMGFDSCCKSRVDRRIQGKQRSRTRRTCSKRSDGTHVHVDTRVRRRRGRRDNLESSNIHHEERNKWTWKVLLW